MTNTAMTNTVLQYQIARVSKENITDSLSTELAEIHLRSFKGFFLSFLGKGFLKNLYKGFAQHPSSGIFIAKNDAEIFGIIAYSEDLSGFYKYLIKKRLPIFAWYAFTAFLRKPSSVGHLLRALKKPKTSKRQDSYMEIASLGVLPEYRETGVGKSLLNETKKIFDKNRSSYIKLETDADDNDLTNRFYIENNFRLLSTFTTPEGRRMNEYFWKPEFEKERSEF